MAVFDERDHQPLAAALGRALLEAGSAEGLLVCEDDGRIGFCNAAAARFLLTVRSRAAGASLERRLARAGDETLRLRFLSALRDHAPTEFVVPRPGAEDEWVEVRGVPLSSGTAFFLRDVTERERGERRLRQSERRLRAASESLRLAHQAARAATWEWRAGGGLRWLDIAAARALVGLPLPPAADGVVADWRSFVDPRDLPAVTEALGKLRDSGAVEFEYRLAGGDGERWLRSHAAVGERQPDGKVARVVGVTLDVTADKLAEAKLQREIEDRVRAEAHQQLLIHELNHRVKNMLATIQSVARQSLGRAEGGSRLADFEERLMALAWTHDVLTQERWSGASLPVILGRTLAPHAAPGRVSLQGPEVRVSSGMALALAMGAHELATNAVKYGALSRDGGRVSVSWTVEDGVVSLDWVETGGPPVIPPARRGFGSRLLERGLAHELGGHVELSFPPDGVRCRIRARLSQT